MDRTQKDIGKETDTKKESDFVDTTKVEWARHWNSFRKLETKVKKKIDNSPLVS